MVNHYDLFCFKLKKNMHAEVHGQRRPFIPAATYNIAIGHSRLSKDRIFSQDE